MTALPRGIDQAFEMAAAELGMCAAARLFVRELAAAGGDDLVREACDRLGRAYPVIDFVAARHLAGEGELPVDAAPVREALSGVARVLVVGVETDHLDALVPLLPEATLGLVLDAGGLDPDFHRVLANYGGRVEGVALGDVARWSGRRSALVTFVYGHRGATIHVSSAWLRVSGPDVRAQFRSLVGWDVFGSPMRLYPRWLVSASLDDLSVLVGP